MIEGWLCRRQGKALTNFGHTFCRPSRTSRSSFSKDPYNFDLLTLSHGAQERDLEAALLEHISKFLLELGVGFAFIAGKNRY
jgi:predicted nuclease of restriction endonuclease-like (RecB) superfamily